MGMNIDNCAKCGKIYVKNLKDMCPACLKEIELQYERCLQYLKENKACKIEELSDATEVSVKQIAKFIREGRISIKNSPNMDYPCDICGTAIRENKICEPCRLRLANDASNVEHSDKLKQEQLQHDNTIAYRISDRLKDRL